MQAHAATSRHRPDRRSLHRRALGRLRRRRGRAGAGPIPHAVRRLALVGFLLGSSGLPHAGELGVNVYGLSYHFERERAEELGTDNEVNPGLGARWRMPREQFDWFLDGGVYRDSGRNTAVYAGGGAFWKPTEHLRLGGALAFFHSDIYNDGDAFIAPLPVVAYEWRTVTLNVVYFPKVSNVNDINTLGFWLTFWPKGF
jgi:hypothetical protein